MSEDERGVVPLRMVRDVASYEPDVKERCYEIWSTIGGMNAVATVRRYEAMVGDELAVPAVRTVQHWAKEEGWQARRDADFRRDHGLRLYELQLKYLAVMEGHADVMLEAQAGAFDHNPAGGIVRLKPGELAGRVIERGILPLVPELPQVSGREWREMSLDEQESFMRDRVQGRKKGGKRA